MGQIAGRFILFLLLLTLIPTANAQVRSEYRGFWVDTFNTSLNNHADVVAVVNNADAAHANAIFAQVRRRGDSWYLNSLEPKPDFITFSPANFDPLQDLITEAHAKGIEVHAFVIVGAVWNKNPTFASTATLGPPTNPNHVFNLHGGYDPVTRTITPGPNNWLTRTLIADGIYNPPTNFMISFQGHRLGAEFWIDLGHPDAAAYSADVLLHLVRNYDIDGLHLDRIRYPELGVAGQTNLTGANIGYNTVSVSRFQTRHGLPAAPLPAPNDALWAQWRRDQVSNFVRRVYLNAIAIRPEIRISAALIAFGNGPTTEAGWTGIRGEAYWRVYQDWRAWTQEGTLDIAIPMVYKREHVTAERTMFDEWSVWLKNHQYNRAGMIGTAGNSPQNSVEGVLRQTRKALSPSAAGNSGVGVIHFSMANTNAAVTANPFKLPSPGNTPLRSFAEVVSGLKTGKSATEQFEDPVANPVGIFSERAFIPDFAWKSNPTKGHLMGFASPVLDTANVTIENVASGETRATATDGGGFYGGVDLAPGNYFVKAVLGSSTLYGCTTNVIAGQVSTTDLAVDSTAPTVNLPAPVVAAEPGSCSAVVSFSVTASDTCLPVSVATDIASGARFNVGTTVVTATATDRAGNKTTTTFPVIVRDVENPIITGLETDKSVLWPPNHKMIDVRVDYRTDDNCGGVTSSLAVTSNEPDEADGDGKTSPDWEIVNEHEVRLRAERSGSGLGRIYTITVTTIDSAGNTTTQSTTVTVPHDRHGGK